MERDQVIDIAKGLGEILVCIGHSNFSTKYEIKSIYQFHMPLFFILSGMVINVDKYSIIKFIKKKMETILFSYYTISFYSLLNSIIHQRNFNYKRYFFQTLKGKQTGKNYWFIYCLFTSQCLSFIILKLILYLFKNKWIRNLLCFILLIFSNYYGYFFAKNRNAYYKLNLTLLIISYILAGYLIQLNRMFFNKYFFNIFFSPIYYIYFFKNVNKNANVYFGNSQVGIPHYSNLVAYLGSLFILSLSKFIKSNYILEYFGKNSLYTFFIHVENINYFDNLTLFLNNFIPKMINPYYRHLILFITLILTKTSIYIQIFKIYFPWFLDFSYFYSFKIKNPLNKKISD